VSSSSWAILDDSNADADARSSVRPDGDGAEFNNLRRQRTVTSVRVCILRPGSFGSPKAPDLEPFRPAGAAPAISADLAAVPQVVIHQREREHRLGDRRGPEPDAWIVPARRDDLDRVAVNVDRTPRHLDARRRFQRDTDENILSARYSAEYSPRRILREAFRRDLVAVLAAALADAAEAVADLDALHGVDAHHRARDLGVELVEDRLAESRRDAGRDHVDPCADGVAFAAQLDHERLELFDLRWIRAEERVRIDGIEIHRVELDRTELGEITANANTDALEQVFPRDRAGRDPHRGLAGGGPSAAAIISEPVLLVVGVIRVARTVAVPDR